MNKKYIFLIILVIASIVGFMYFFTRNNTTTQSKYSAERTSQNITNSTENIINELANNTADNEKNQTQKNEKKKPEEKPKEDEQKKETEIASFTTKIYTKDSGRQNNLTLACSTLNNTTVENGKTFSFSKTVGRATSGKGYKKADVFRNGDVVEALGGGLCQVSTTLYNAVLYANLEVVERHDHGKEVYYVPLGQDAAVAHDSCDFKFKNNSTNDIKMYLSSDDENVYATLVKLEY